MLKVQLFGKPLAFDWSHALLSVWTTVIVVLGWELTPEAQGLKVKIPVATATALLGLCGMLARSVFHIPTPPSAGSGGGSGGGVSKHEETTLPDGKLPIPTDRTVREAFARRSWQDDPRSWDRRGVVRGVMLAPLLFLLRCLPASVAPTLQSIQGWLGYVTTFVQGAQALWAVILPLLGSKAPDENAVFQKAVQEVTNAQAAIDEALQAAEAAMKPAPDLSALIASVQAAVARVMAIVQSFERAPGDAGAAPTARLVGGSLVTSETLAHHAGIIGAYRQPRAQ